MKGTFTGLRPDITPAQLVAVLLAGIPILSNLLAAFEVFTVTVAQQAALSEAVQWGGIFAGLLIGGDTLLRAARNSNDAKVQAAALTPVPPAGADGPPQLPAGGIPGDVDGDGVIDEEERALLDAAERGELPSDEEEFAPVGRETPDDPDGDGLPGIGAVGEGGEFPPARS